MITIVTNLLNLIVDNMKHFRIVLIFLLFFLCSCADSSKKTEQSYTVTYEVLYPNNTRQFTVQTKKGKAKVRKWHTGFFNGGPMVYSLVDECPRELAYEEFPIVIINQKIICQDQ